MIVPHDQLLMSWHKAYQLHAVRIGLMDVKPCFHKTGVNGSVIVAAHACMLYTCQGAGLTRLLVVGHAVVLVQAKA